MGESNYYYFKFDVENVFIKSSLSFKNTFLQHIALDCKLLEGPPRFSPVCLKLLGSHVALYYNGAVYHPDPRLRKGQICSK